MFSTRAPHLLAGWGPLGVLAFATDRALVCVAGDPPRIVCELPDQQWGLQQNSFGFPVRSSATHLLWAPAPEPGQHPPTALLAVLFPGAGVSFVRCRISSIAASAHSKAVSCSATAVGKFLDPDVHACAWLGPHALVVAGPDGGLRQVRLQPKSDQAGDELSVTVGPLHGAGVPRVTPLPCTAIATAQWGPLGAARVAAVAYASCVVVLRLGGAASAPASGPPGVAGKPLMVVLPLQQGAQSPGAVLVALAPLGPRVLVVWATAGAAVFAFVVRASHADGGHETWDVAGRASTRLEANAPPVAPIPTASEHDGTLWAAAAPTPGLQDALSIVAIPPRRAPANEGAGGEGTTAAWQAQAVVAHPSGAVRIEALLDDATGALRGDLRAAPDAGESPHAAPGVHSFVECPFDPAMRSMIVAAAIHPTGDFVALITRTSYAGAKKFRCDVHILPSGWAPLPAGASAAATAAASAPFASATATSSPRLFCAIRRARELADDEGGSFTRLVRFLRPHGGAGGRLAAISAAPVESENVPSIHHPAHAALAVAGGSTFEGTLSLIGPTRSGGGGGNSGAAEASVPEGEGSTNALGIAGLSELAGVAVRTLDVAGSAGAGPLATITQALRRRAAVVDTTGAYAVCHGLQSGRLLGRSVLIAALEAARRSGASSATAATYALRELVLPHAVLRVRAARCGRAAAWVDAYAATLAADLPFALVAPGASAEALADAAAAHEAFAAGLRAELAAVTKDVPRIAHVPCGACNSVTVAVAVDLTSTCAEGHLCCLSPVTFDRIRFEQGKNTAAGRGQVKGAEPMQGAARQCVRCGIFDHGDNPSQPACALCDGLFA
jgi:hypothetical protein